MVMNGQFESKGDEMSQQTTHDTCGKEQKARWIWAWLTAFVLLIISGLAYRVIARRLEVIVDTPILLDRPLRELPLVIGPWHGRDVPMPPAVQRVAANDDFVNREYINTDNGDQATLYIAFSARPRTMIGHNPQTCMVAQGWVHDGVQTSTFTDGSGKQLPCLIHRFHQPVGARKTMFILNYYIINGRISVNEQGFSGLGWRTPNIAGRAARYVAQVQIGSAMEHTVRQAAAALAGPILSFFPCENQPDKAEE